MSSSERLQRLHTVDTRRGDVEVGYADAIQRHYQRQVVNRAPVTQRRLEFEKRRPKWLRECIAEAMGVFFYVYPGIAAICALTLATGDPATEAISPVFGNFLSVALAFSLGIAFAIICFAHVSGGQFNPAVTISLVVWQGFPLRKAWYFILSQIFGAFIAGLLLMGQYHVQIKEFTDRTIAAGMSPVSSSGPASILVTIPAPDQTNEGYLFLIEFFVDSFIGLVIWACLDRANPFTSPIQAPFTIGLAYGVMIIGFGHASISTNMARDLGCRIVAAIFYGGEVFTYHNYAWISILVNIPATVFATGLYEFVMRDSLDRLGKGTALHEDGDSGLHKHLTNEGMLLSDEAGVINATGMDRDMNKARNLDV